jgi:hypothetical protein
VEMRKQEKLAEWQLACEAVRKLKLDSQAAKARSEQEYANARTQQEAERAERAIKDAAAALKVRRCCCCCRWHCRCCWHLEMQLARCAVSIYCKGCTGEEKGAACRPAPGGHGEKQAEQGKGA